MLVAAVVFVGLAFMPVAAHADLFSPDRPLFIIETEYFTLVYPQESTRTAVYLASFADDTYKEVASLLGTAIQHRIPVVITPDSEVANGYYTVYPYPRIVLYEAAIDPDSPLGSFRDDLKSVFIHELTHAVSLGIRPPLEEAVVGIFGEPLGISAFLTPMAFVEGVTVSFESLEGHGRAVDPLAGAILRQDVLEDNWKTFRQAAGAWDSYPARALYYIYGGYFSRYLQQRFGMENYAALWREFGAAALFTPLDDTWLRKGRFSRVFGVSLSSAWEDFRVSMVPRTPVSVAVEKLTPPSVIGALAASGTTLYYFDAPSESVRSLDTVTRTDAMLFRSSARITRIDVAADGSTILVSAVETEKGLARIGLKEWDVKAGRLRDLPYSRVRDAAYLEGFRSIGGSDAAVACILVDGYRTDIAVLDNGNANIILRGTDRLSYSSPVPSEDGSTLYALARKNGTVSVVRIALTEEGGKIRAASAERLILPGELTWIRYLSYDDGILRFSWDDSAFYRLAELEGGELRFQQVPMSGGVHEPLASGGGIYHLGNFSEGQSLCKFPVDRKPLSFARSEAAWEDVPELLPSTAKPEAASHPDASPYRALRWLVPRFWLPSAKIDLNGLISAGAVIFVADPVERLDASLSAEWNVRMEAADLQLELAWTRWAVPISFRLFDTFLASADGQQTRISGLSLGVGGSGSDEAGGDYSWNFGTALEGFAETADGSSPYAPWTGAAAALEPSILYEDITAPSRDKEKAAGFSFGALLRVDAPVMPEAERPLAGLEAGLAAYLHPGAFKLELHGAVSLTGGLEYGPDGRVYPSGQQRAGDYPVWADFAGGDPGPWFAGGEASIRLLGAEIQNGIGAFHANRLSVRMGARGTLGAYTAWSVFGRLSLTWTPVVGTFARLHPSSYLELWARPDLASDGHVPHGLAFMLVSSY
jgi:hypothetical protein